jgi:3-hydroxyacyl-CoA dehydrogenase/enoyl-CoA hydratase/3-hydroxybutyryl-CoA epimerase
MSKSLQFCVDSNGVATIVFDLKNEKVNKLSAGVLLELEKTIDNISKDDKIRLLLIKSAKKDIFIAGADIKEIQKIKNPSDAYKKVFRGQAILSKIANLNIPTVAVINGACLGGGLELALACTYRIVTDNKKTVLGLPEVNLGIIPGFGGTQRLPRLVGLEQSLKMILPGKPVDYKKAFKIHLADKIIREEFLDDQLNDFIASVLVDNSSNPVLSTRRVVRRKRFTQEVLLGTKHIIYYFAKKNLLKQTKGKYPAPLSALNVIKETYHSSDYDAGLKKEAEEFSQLASGEIAKNLLELFFINEEIKKDNGAENEIEVKDITQAGLLGAGVMGGGIAWLFSNFDIPMRMRDISLSAIALGFNQVLKIYTKLKNIKKYTQSQIDLKIHNITSTTSYEGFDKSDIVIEAIIEDIEIKKNALKELENHIPKDAIIASNTSSLSIDKMAQSLQNPERFIGMHFFNPVNKMPLVEVIKGEKTSDKTIATIVALSKKLKKTPIVVANVEGFLVNRILMPYINEAAFLLQDGASIKTIDKTIEDFGMPMGPLTLADTVGIDIGHKVGKILSQAYGKRMQVCDLLESISKEKNIVGKKSGQGFYKYNKSGKNLGINPKISNIISKNKKAVSSNKSDTDNQNIIDRCILIMVNEASKCLEEKVVKNHRYLDMAMIMGTGFPVFRGGLLKYADHIGIGVVVSRLQELSATHGKRFAPSKSLLSMAKKSKTFY